MAKTEMLLQELVDLKKKELKGMQIRAALRFVFITLPMFALIILSIYGSVILFEQVQNTITDLPNTIGTQIEDAGSNQIDGILEQFGY
ncbi:hypothetical protein HOD30_04250 [Candidatus Peregrinibacteria bacterium]|jgi:hypothetical protein|nr:hypothetical protein [Candidatus Peregrinibacteria bacterium]MBT4632171.1 hypothetical protein [Candidatus Peregrinibacteria bacterium]MBT5516732.1 hypothetical protein [Candidatus Peregrinibacteria bacterium]MBT5824089.1 hypothetical protein [Candidatus Peregrinibacteria bacterium]